MFFFSGEKTPNSESTSCSRIGHFWFGLLGRYRFKGFFCAFHDYFSHVLFLSQKGTPEKRALLFLRSDLAL